jgi:hypothetical protein
MILTHESGSQEDQFGEKNGGQKSHDTIPLKRVRTWIDVRRELYEKNIQTGLDRNILIS